MRISRILAAILLVGGVLITSSAALAIITPVSIVVGDVDNYGGIPGASDQGTAIWDGPGANGLGMDRRSAIESAAANGAQITDVYSAMDPISGPNNFTTASVIIPIPAGLKIHDGSFSMAMGDFQSTQFGPFNMTFNGIAESLAFQDGFQVTTIRSFVLTPAEIAAANMAGEFICNFDRDDSIDAIAFDWFKLDANVEPVPLPSTALLLGTGLLGLAGLRRSKRS
jgi:hypothetical protein